MISGYNNDEDGIWKQNISHIIEIKKSLLLELDEIEIEHFKKNNDV